jgi:molybdopterin synthase catalytic subunit
MDFALSSLPLDPAALAAGLADTRAGACVTFEGRVRNLNEGRAVVALEYEAYGPLAETEGTKIVAEAREKFAVLAVACAHRTGRLALGDLAVWVGVTAAHRGAAFDACRYVIDELKARVPVWKKEHYADGATEWINCAPGGSVK